MTKRRPVEAIGTVEPVEAMARALIAALLPALEAAMLGGLTYRQTMAEASRQYGPAWMVRYGADVAFRAMQILDHVGPAAILTPCGRELFLREYPLAAIPKGALPGANDNAPPPLMGIGQRLLQAWVSFWRWPPASSA